MQFSAKWLPLIAFFAFLTKTMLISPSFADSIIVCGLISYIILDNLRLKDNQIEKFKQEMKNFKEVTEKVALDVRNLQSKTSAMSLGQGLRPIGNTVPKEQPKKSEW